MVCCMHIGPCPYIILFCNPLCDHIATGTKHCLHMNYDLRSNRNWSQTKQAPELRFAMGSQLATSIACIRTQICDRIAAGLKQAVHASEVGFAIESQLATSIAHIRTPICDRIATCPNYRMHICDRIAAHKEEFLVHMQALSSNAVHVLTAGVPSLSTRPGHATMAGCTAASAGRCTVRACTSVSKYGYYVYICINMDP